MYAIIKTGGKQYKVQAGDVLQVEKLDNDLGSEVTFAEILMVSGDKTHVGSPLVKNAVVTVSDNAVIGQNVNSNEIPSIEKIVAQTEEALKKRTEFNNKTYEEYMK